MKSYEELTAYNLLLTAVPMFRKTLTILSLIGLLLSVGLWGVSYFRLEFVLPSLRHYVSVSSGAMELHCLTAPTIPDDWRRLARQEISMLGYDHFPVNRGTQSTTRTEGGVVTASYTYFPPAHQIVGFRSLHTRWMFTYRRTGVGGSGETIIVQLPLWIPTIIFFAVVSYACYPTQFYRRRKRKKLGLCLKCGYDLRGSTDRCPECGTGFSDSDTTQPSRATS